MIRVQLLHRNHCWICLLDIRRRKFVALKEVIAGKSINAALFRGRRSIGAALKRVNTVYALETFRPNTGQHNVFLNLDLHLTSCIVAIFEQC
jgi:hypothetical protein